jgi:hypothetical protein
MSGSTTSTSTFPAWLWGREIRIGSAYMSISSNGKFADMNDSVNGKPVLTLLTPERVEGWIIALEVLTGRRRP